MRPDYLVPENERTEDGSGPTINATPTQCLLTLGITRVAEREGLEVSIWGSEDGEDWGSEPIAKFPPKSYCGLYKMRVDLTRKPAVRQLRAAWKMRTWKPEDRHPLFQFYVQVAQVEGQQQMKAMSASA